MSVTESLKVAERDWQRTVIEAAQLLGWRVAHFRPAKTAHGWRTPVQADGEGYFDLTMTRGSRVLFVELKAEKGRVSPAQRGWIEAMEQVAFANEGVQVHVWRPSDWDEAERCLR